jgi:hypothetical protein
LPQLSVFLKDRSTLKLASFFLLEVVTLVRTSPVLFQTSFFSDQASLETQTPSDLPAFLLNNTLCDILKQVNVISTRQVQIDNMLVKQQQRIDNLTAAVLRQTTTS